MSKTWKWILGILVAIVVIIVVGYYSGWLKFGKISFGK